MSKEEKKEEKKTKYSIDKIETAKQKIEQTQSMKEGIIPRYPFSFMLCGRSGSGKTNLLMNLLTKKDLYGGYFHYIIVFSPTASSSDDMYDVLKLPPENFIPEFGPDQLQNLINSRKKLIKKKGIQWVAKNSRVLIVLDDIIANRGFLESQTALTLFALLRHYLVSIIVLMQSYTKLPRSLRLNCNAVAVFPSSQSEVEVLIDEITPAGIKKRDFEKVIDYCTDQPYSFLYINNHAERGKNVRKNLDEIVDLNKFKKDK